LRGGRFEVTLPERSALMNSLDSLRIPYKTIPISHFHSSIALATFQKTHSVAMRIDRRYQVIIAPDDIVDELRMIVSGKTTLGCILLCNDPERPTLTRHSITVFHKDGHTTVEKLCQRCQEESLISMVGHFLDPVDGSDLLLRQRDKIPMIPLIDFTESANHEIWPQIPIGSHLLALFKEDDRMEGLLNMWIQAVYQQTLHKSPEIVLFCPNHPMIPIPADHQQNKPRRCPVLNCYLAFCQHCRDWHQTDQLCLASISMKKCPQCNIRTSKAGGCNHMTCRCGCHWCYICMEKFNGAAECYEHLMAIHSGFGIGDEEL
jgi:hypothetical protein